ncbi:zinc finger MYM-type protein 1-like [Bolinopsis microptera]|uniref:zinc finger MYM-type protein 1-like n=1 Tax=Bolinopsis microptera TaxID=2820187 RepID=UPI00307A19A1
MLNLLSVLDRNVTIEDDNEQPSCSSTSSMCTTDPVIDVPEDQQPTLRTELAVSTIKQHTPKDSFIFPKSTSNSGNRSCQHQYFKEFPWLHYDVKTDSVFCTICANAKRTGSEQLVKSLTETRSIERHYLRRIITTVRYLARQGIPLSGKNGEDNFSQLLKLRAEDDSILKERLNREADDRKQGGNKVFFSYRHPTIQNEILDIMGQEVVRTLLRSKIQKCRFFSLICDEGTDVANNTFVTICLRTIDENLKVSEDFMGFYHVANIKSDSIVAVIKDALKRFALKLSDCRGQTYDGASNMLGPKSGVSTRILKENPLALANHCLGHALNLEVKAVNKNCKPLSLTTDTTEEIVKLVRYSPKRENMLSVIQSDIIVAADDEEDIPVQQKILGLSSTRWTERDIVCSFVEQLHDTSSEDPFS